jgi:tetratricopeptide (TPR) repeat protein
MNDNWKTLYNQGKMALSRQDLDTAAQLWQQALEMLLQNPNHEKSDVEMLQANINTLLGKNSAISNESDAELENAKKLQDLGKVSYQKGNYLSAAVYWQGAFEIRQRVLGLEHQDTLSSMNNLAATKNKMGDYRGAEELLEQALKGRTQNLGPEHEDTLGSMSNLAAAKSSMGLQRCSRITRTNPRNSETGFRIRTFKYAAQYE